MSGRVVHFEIPFDDAERANAFYRAAFGWEIAGISPAYSTVTTGPSANSQPTEPGFVNGGLLRRESPESGPILVIEVDDIDAALERVGEAGGRTLITRRAVADAGYTAYFKDVEGNIMGLWQHA